MAGNGEINALDSAGGNDIRIDLARMVPRLRPHNLQRELLVRAAKVKPRAVGAAGAEASTEGVTVDGAKESASLAPAPARAPQPLRAVDATAGFGSDALLLAAAGFNVQLFERNPAIAAALREALDRAAQTPELAEAVSRMRLTQTDSIVALPQLPEPPDVIVLDPMFPAKRKSAASRKKAQLLQHLEQPCADEDALLQAALAAHPRKIVVKRPLKGPYLADVKPNYSLKGKAVRYDVIVPVPSTADNPLRG
ncbi:MAG: class I SAM-dependent methyltransferase [Eggerthellaceae bacterium]|nr:class I SAM-dependent methyltransferase [Eggerthellaceae bacterium]